MIDLGSLIPSIIGLGAKTAAAIPGLKKPPKSKTAKAVAASAPGVYGSAVGAAQAGHGASRGLALREGLRQATGGVSKLGEQIRLAAATDENINQQRTEGRNQRLADFGSDLAKGLGDMAAIAVGPKGGPQDPNRPAVEVSPNGFGTPQDPGDVGTKGLDDLEAGMADQEAVEQQQLIDEAGQQLEDFKLKREEAGLSAAPEQKSEQETTASLIEEAYGMKPELSPAIEKELAQTLHLKQLMLAEMERTGSNFGEMIPRVTRRLGLAPGQSLQNPHAVSADLDVTGEA